MQLRLHSTRQPPPSELAAEGVGARSGQLTILSGRPNTDSMMEQLGRDAGRVDRAGRGIAVVCCGPRPMVRDVGRQVLAADLVSFLCVRARSNQFEGRGGGCASAIRALTDATGDLWFGWGAG